MQFVRKKRRSPAINIINLIDVLVVLLIFYIVTTVFKKTENNIIIKVPKSTDAGVTNEYMENANRPRFSSSTGSERSPLHDVK